jgi:protein TonB
MQKKSNRTRPDRIILFEVGIIVALFFVNYTLGITYGSGIIMDDPIVDTSDPVYTLGTFEDPEIKEPEKQKVKEVASIFDPIAVIKPIIDDLFKPKVSIIAPPTLPKVGAIKPIVVKPRIDTTNKIVDFPEINPTFPGGEKAMFKYILDNYNIPDIVYQTTDQVKLVVEFVIGKDGQLSDFKILKSSNPGLGTEREAKRVYTKMPAWTPGKNNGRNTSVRLRQPLIINVY